MEQPKIVKRKLSALKKSPVNIRLHSEKQMTEYKRSVKKNGVLKLPVIDENNVIWCGNGLYDAMVAEGYTETFCILKTGMTEVEKKEMMTSENRIHDLGVVDMDVFDSFLKEFAAEGPLDIPGYDSELLETLLATPLEVDEAMSMYGVVPEERKEEIKANAGIYDNAPVGTQPPAVTSGATPANEPSEALHEPSERKYVLCPKCGEKIWL